VEGPVSATVRAALCRAYGPPEDVVVDDVAPPVLGPGQVRVRVEAAAVNFPDVLLVQDEYQLSVPPPFVPGSEFAGIVTERGDDVGGDGAPAIGDRVTGTSFVGAFAEEIVVDAAVTAPVPDGVDLRHAAAFGVAHKTAYHTLRSVARLQPGEELVVLGAGGGVGLAAVQLGAVLGATVTAVASTRAKLEAAAAAGATHLIDHRAGELRPALREALPEGSDVVLDPVGGALSEPALRSLRWDGRFVTVGYAAGEIPRIPLNLVLLKGCRILGFEFRSFVTHAPDEVRRNDDELAVLLASGRVVPHIGATFALADTAAALRHVADGEAVGKVLIEVAGHRVTR
jgi:NADPH2:quinone reductase